ncbi:YcgL domain-containing protein [Larsenimonas rhizosphaerae]|uniref:YcgL domain-containing protein OQ287_10140 n=1 Tax=Larsenimonas rhizosphaerae TaxID=2944682 RepID=A0AA41ZG19_9GAMM|nr:YcgL domain-containing protein [Larsenimonas rhizosphaerae]MCM2132001.1 YcgL domain-containing protein [Larsenimonas rhizosphaerae]MCX2524604.1 YcgL domain-containing protein [Larsenimonas rhizosphaerae]
MIDRLLCDIYKSSRRDEMYLYVVRGDSLKDLPDALREVFGPPIMVMPIMLIPDKPMARTTAVKVMTSVRQQGFYLQMPPAKEPGMLDMYRAPTEGRY